MKKRHSCTKERLCGCVRTRLDKTIIDTVVFEKEYPLFDGGRFLAQAEDGGK